MDGNPEPTIETATDGLGDFQPNAEGLYVIDPSTGAGSGGGNSDDGNRAGKRRGRPRGSTNAPKDQATLKGVDLKAILLSIHLMLAARTSISQLALDEEEAGRLEEAIKRVWKHYPVNVTQKQLDIAMAVYAVGDIYGTRLVSIYLDRRNAGKEQAPQNPAQGFAMPPGVMPFPRAGN